MNNAFYNNKEFVNWLDFNTCFGVECGWKWFINDYDEKRINFNEGKPLTFFLRWQMNALDGEEYEAPLASYGVYGIHKRLGGEYEGHEIDAYGAIKALIAKLPKGLKEFVESNTKDIGEKIEFREFILDYMKRRWNLDQYLKLPIDIESTINNFCLERA